MKLWSKWQKDLGKEIVEEDLLSKVLSKINLMELNHQDTSLKIF